MGLLMTKGAIAVVVLAVATVGLQGANLWKQYYPAQVQQASRPVATRDAGKDDMLALTGLPTRGDAKAQVVLVEFSDYECPYCARHAGGVGREIEREYVAAGKVREAFVNLPLPIHEHARMLGGAAVCAGEQGKYWEAHDALFEQKPKTETEALAALRPLKLKADKLRTCMAGAGPVKVLERDTETSKRFKLTGTPSFALGRVEAGSVVHIDRFIMGAQPFVVFQAEIERELRD